LLAARVVIFANAKTPNRKFRARKYNFGLGTGAIILGRQPRKDSPMAIESWMNMETESERGEVVNKSQLCRMFGISRGFIDSAILRGAPIVSQGVSRTQGAQINTADFLEWWRADSLKSVNPYQQAKHRKQVAIMEGLERENRERGRQLLPVADADRLVEAEYDIVRGVLDSLPDRMRAIVAELVPDVKYADEVEAFARNEMTMAKANLKPVAELFAEPNEDDADADS
jgi:hypothetical protein